MDIPKPMSDGDAMLAYMKAAPGDSPNASPHGCALKAMQAYTFATMRDTGEVYVYRNGIYVPEGKIIEEFAQAYFKVKCTNGLVGETYGHIRRSTLVNRSAFDADFDTITVKNGLLNLKTGLQPHDSGHLSLVQLPVEYNPRARCPKIMRFLREATTDRDGNEHPEKVNWLLMYAGYLLLRSSTYKKILYLVGPPDTAKSKVIGLFRAFAGESNCAQARPNDLSEHDHYKAELVGKMLCTHGDTKLSAADLSGLRALSGGDTVPARRKYGHPFPLLNTAKFIFASNKLPDLTLADPADFARLFMIQFERRFVLGEDADEHILDKITTPQELSGFLNQAIKGLKILQKYGGFPDLPLPEKIAAYERKANPVIEFLEKECMFTTDGYVTTAELQKAAEKHLLGQNLEVPKNLDVILGKTLNLHHGIERSQKRVPGGKVHIYVGVALRKGQTVISVA